MDRSTVAADFRSEPSDSPEGKGIARRAWDSYESKMRPVTDPVFLPLGEAVARKWIVEMLGFYVAWHLYGGFEGLRETLGMHPSTIWRKVAKFRKMFGVHPDEATFAGVTIDPKLFWNSAETVANPAADPKS